MAPKGVKGVFSAWQCGGDRSLSLGSSRGCWLLLPEKGTGRRCGTHHSKWDRSREPPNILSKSLALKGLMVVVKNRRSSTFWWLFFTVMNRRLFGTEQGPRDEN